MTQGVVAGLEDMAGLAHWMQANGLATGDVVPRAELIAGGRSNLTYRLDLPTGALVLRRPPLGHVLPSAHDMSREYTVMTALYGTDVPVPRPVALCGDTSVIGAPFYLMEWVDGAVLRTSDDAAVLSPGQAGELSRRFVEMLATIHGVDVAACGLASFGRPEGYLARQLARWQKQWELSVTRDVPGYGELTARLVAGLTAPGGPGGPDPSGQGGPPSATLVHGDFRLDNTMVTAGETPEIVAVVDWEMSTLGDPLADLGLTLVYWTQPGEDAAPGFGTAAPVTTAPGFWTRDALAAHYASLTGRDLSHLNYYMAFACFKLAVVLEGIRARYLQHKTVGEGFDQSASAVPSLVARAHTLLDTKA
ncbi:MAG TPA: phosphotransferase family protein [Streptosporangiaceae bacterium]|nr:phosphotransferase family protein [Streptosporangiaceae bacterium]